MKKSILSSIMICLMALFTVNTGFAQEKTSEFEVLDNFVTSAKDALKKQQKLF